MERDESEVFRYPEEAGDEIIPNLTLSEWAQGKTEEGDYSRVYEPGEVVRFCASRTVDHITYLVGDTGLEGPTAPEETTRFCDAHGYGELQGETLADIYEQLQEAGLAVGEEITLICYADWIEYWQCEGRFGHVETYTFVPASLGIYLDRLRAALEDHRRSQYGLEFKTRRALTRATPTPKEIDLETLVRDMSTALKGQPDAFAPRFVERSGGSA